MQRADRAGGPRRYRPRMAMVWLPLDDAAIDSMLIVARSSWAPADLDATWAAAGWTQPAGESVAHLVFTDMNYTLSTGERLVRLGMRFDPDAITSLCVDFATYYPETDLADPEVADLVSPSRFGRWSADATATRADFDARYAEALDRLAARLGAPVATGRHSEEWSHAVWRQADVLLVLAQGENFDTYGEMDDACLWAVRHPADAPVPFGENVYALLCGTYADSPK